MYADDILLLASTVSAVQRLLNVCQCKLQYLDMAINAKKSVCTISLARVINNRVVICLLRIIIIIINFIIVIKCTD